MTKNNNHPRGFLTSKLNQFLGLGIVSFLFTAFSLELLFSSTHLAPVWFPSAIMMCAFWRFPVRQWAAPAVACIVGSVCASMLLLSHDQLNFMFPVINLAEAVTGALLLKYLLPNDYPLESLPDWLKLVVASAVVPPVLGGLLVLLATSPHEPLNVFFVWVVSEAIGCLAIVPIGLQFSPQSLRRLLKTRSFLETLATMAATLLLSYLALRFLPWPFTFVIVFLMWSAIRLPQVAAFAVALVSIMGISLMFALGHTPAALITGSEINTHAPWLPFLLLLLPAHIMTMVMHSFREERKNITASETRFRNAMEHSAIGMALVGVDGRWLQVNKALCKFLGYTHDQLRNLTFQQITFPEDLHTDLQYMDKLLSGEINSYSMEKRYYNSKGNIVWALLAVSVVRDANNTPLYVIAQVEDINDLKHSEWMNKRLMERITLANEAGGIGIWEWDMLNDQISWDKRMFELYGVPGHLKPSFQLWMDCLVEDDQPVVKTEVTDALRRKEPFKVEYRIQVQEETRHIRTLANRVLNKQGNVERYLGISMDMTEVKQLHDALYQEKERLHITLDAIGEAVICTDVDMRITFMNPVAEKMSGWPQEQAFGQYILSVLHITFGENGPAMENIYSGDATRSAMEQDVILHSRTGDSFDIHYSITPLSTLDGESIGTVLVIHDVTESRKMLRQLTYSASHDGLTHLANRASFENHLKRLLASAVENRQQHALVFIDLDRFKAVNDTAGHAAGDSLLRELSTLMLSLLRNNDFLARLGGDEFALLLPNCSVESARHIAEHITSMINDYHFIWEEQTYRIGASAGITIIDEHNYDANEVLSQADIACYASKNSGRGRVSVFEAKKHTNQRKKNQLSAEEQQAIIAHNPVLITARPVASPRIPESCSFYLLGVQLWNNAGDMIEENHFRAALSSTDLHKALDLRMIELFFKEHARRVIVKGFTVALSLSVAGLNSGTVVETLVRLLRETRFPPARLMVIVENQVVGRIDGPVRQGLEQLVDAGCVLALSQVGDDLDIFNQIPRHLFKAILLEQSLVQHVHENLMDEMMVTIIQGHAQRLKLQTIGGPVAQAITMDTLSGIGMDLIFGDSIGPQQPLEVLLNGSYFAIN
ncbi:diguanylate cyclase [Mangrovibacter sp. MFB070]|uniref:diguanylate cyclase n=1 Tax=Mangrovibacter sp. MFB070 TaxID=1224318 RepID=UPI0004D5EACF|nr:diguanylate cyclase [Mangrovibacter sp. MFB070]KEA50554.1 diguanylate cyclase [Mangrovibacter sp. MFB070]